MYLGYEEPVAMPSMGVYDTDLMKAYIAGVKEQYDNARQDMKDFNKLYGDFYSPIAGDTENYYNLTVGGANKLIDDLMAQGIDPYKNPQARNLISRYIANVPTDKLNQMKQSAENATAYNAAKAKMIADGTYSQEMADFLGEDPSNWDTMKNGVYNRVAPTRFNTIEDMLLPTIQQLQKSYKFNEAKSKATPGYNIYDVSEAQTRDAINSIYGDLLKQPSMQFHLAQSGLTPEQFKEMLVQQAVSQTPEHREKDDVWFLNQNLAMERAKMANDWAIAKYKINEAKNKPGNGGQQNNDPNQISWTDTVDYANTGVSEHRKKVSQVDSIKYAQKALVKSEKVENGKVVRTFKNDDDKKLYYKYGKLINILNKDKLNTSDENWLKANKFINNDKSATEKLEQIFDQQFYDNVKNQIKKANSTSSIDGKIKIADNLYTTNSSQPQGYFQDTARKLFSGSDKSGDKVANIRSGDANLEYSPVARMKMFGIFYKKTNINGNRSLFVEFSNLLKSENVPALDSGNSVRVTPPINGYRHISGDVKITYNDFKNIASKLGYSGREKELLQKLGLTSTYNSQESRKYNNAYKLEDVRETMKDNYVYIPMTRSIKQGSYEDASINNSHQAYMLGKGFAGKNLFGSNDDQE